MFRSLVYASVLLGLLGICAVGIAQAKECGITGATFNQTGPYTYLIQWSYVDDCGDATFEIQRRCCDGGPWVTVVKGFEGTQYEDVIQDDVCKSGDYQHKLIIDCGPTCYCTGPMCEVASTCPW